MTTIDYYNKNAEDFVNKTFDADVSVLRGEFVEGIPSGGKILDVGCGSGRDVLAFSKMGYNVTAFDASESIVELAKEKTGLNILVMKMEDIAWENEFNGIWSVASLLHLRKDEFRDVINKCSVALKDNGSIFVSLKMGTGEGEDNNGRFFSYYSMSEVLSIIKELDVFKDVVCYETSDVLSRGISWINILAKKKELVLDKRMRNKL